MKKTMAQRAADQFEKQATRKSQPGDLMIVKVGTIAQVREMTSRGWTQTQTASVIAFGAGLPQYIMTKKRDS